MVYMINFRCIAESERKYLRYVMDSNFEQHDFPDFESLISSAISGVGSLRHMQYVRKDGTRKRKSSGKPGPKATTAKFKLYHLPDACPLPQFKSASEYQVGGTIKQHFNLKIMIYTYFFNKKPTKGFSSSKSFLIFQKFY